MRKTPAKVVGAFYQSHEEYYRGETRKNVDIAHRQFEAQAGMDISMQGFDPAVRLREHLAGLPGRHCSRADLIDVMRLSRLIIENKNLSGNYPHLALYCDWLLHTEIDRHGLVLRLLEQMHDAVVNYDKTRDIEAVSRLLNLAMLRAEMLILFSSHKIGTDLMDSLNNWRKLVGTIILDLCDRPLRLPKTTKGKTKKAVEAAIFRMKAKCPPDRPMWARAFYLKLEREQSPLSVSWILECAAPFLTGGDTLNIASTIVMTETAKDFKRP